jgi:Rad3-related DNA helicase
MSRDLLNKTQEILNKANLPDRHTFFQIEKFIIGKEPTVQAQLWAIIRELQARFDSVEQLNKDLKDSEDNLELFDIKIERLNRFIKSESNNNEPDNDLNIKEHEINIRKLQREKEVLILSARKLNNKLKNILEEVNYLVSGYEKIIKNYGEIKPLDDEQSQKEMWNEKFLEEFNLRIILQRPLDPEFVKTVLCLHDDASVKKQVISLVENVQKKMIADKSTNNNPQASINQK